MVIAEIWIRKAICDEKLVSILFFKSHDVIGKIFDTVIIEKTNYLTETRFDVLRY